MDTAQMIRLVRGIVADEGDPPLFGDQKITDVLALYASHSEQATVYYSAAYLLDQIAVSEVLLAKKLTTQDLSTDGPAVSAELRAHAARLRAQAAAEDDDAAGDVGFFHIVPGRPSPRLEGEEWSCL